MTEVSYSALLLSVTDMHESLFAPKLHACGLITTGSSDYYCNTHATM